MDRATEQAMDRATDSEGPVSAPRQSVPATIEQRVAPVHRVPVMQPPLVLGAVDDPAEADADRIARALFDDGSAAIFAPADGAGRIRRSATVPSTSAIPSDVESRIRRSAGSGSSIPDPIRRTFSDRLGTSLDDLSIHRNSDLPGRIQARAFTVGNDVWLGPSERLDSVGGQATLAHEVGHVMQNRATDGDTARRMVRRLPLTSDGVFDAVSKIGIVKQYLKLTPDRTNVADVTQVETVRATIRRIFDSYEAELEPNAADTTASAMKIAIALEQVAKVIALNVLNDPAQGPVLATKLFQLYDKELRKGVGKRTDVDDVMKLASALTAADPVARYMHDEISVDVAAREIRIQANLGGKKPLRMFDLLSQKFEAEAATWTQAQATATEDRGNASSNFSVSGTNGELSADYFAKLFGAAAAGSMTRDGRRKRAAFDPAAKAKLLALRTQVDAVPGGGFTGAAATWNRKDATTGAVTETHDLSHQQSAHLAGAAANDANNYVGIDATVAGLLQAMFNLASPAEGQQLVTDVRIALAAQPVTLTVDAAAWFSHGNAPARGNIYQAASRRNQTKTVKQVLGRGRKDRNGQHERISHLGKFNDTSGQDRTENYGRFRNWKDRKMALASNVQLTDDDLPNFAALNANWEAKSSKSLSVAEYAVNSYGNLHFHLRKDHLQGRILYTAGDHGRPHADPFLALADFLLADTKEQSATGLKVPKDEGFAKKLILGIVGGAQVAMVVQKFEAQIFGEIDVSKDVSRVSLAPSVNDPTLVANIQGFCANVGAAFEHIATPLAPLSADYSGAVRSLAQQVQARTPPPLPPPVAVAPVVDDVDDGADDSSELSLSDSIG